MKTALLLTLTVSLIGCAVDRGASPVVARSTKDDSFIFRMNAMNGTIELKGLVLHCANRGGNHPDKKKYLDCKEVPVVVLETSGGECKTLLPYNELHVHTHKDKEDVTIEWTLLASKDRYRFKKSGKPGVDLKDTAQSIGGSKVDPKLYYEDLGDGGSSDKYIWKFKLRAMQDIKRFDHDALVERIDDKGDWEADCEPLDPVITNAS